MEIEMTIDGLEPLVAKLKEIGGQEAINMVRGGVRAGASVIRKEAVRLCPEESGGKHPDALKKSIRLSSRVRDGEAQAFIKAGNADAFYAYMVEFGTAAHAIKASNRELLINGNFAGGSVEHPGAQPRPFMRPALDTKSQPAIYAIRDYIAKRLAKYSQ